MNKIEKAEKLISDDMIFKASDYPHIMLFICKGSSGKVYEIFYKKDSNTYHCNCNNIRVGSCYHIVAAHKIRTGDILYDCKE